MTTIPHIRAAGVMLPVVAITLGAYAVINRSFVSL